MEYSFAENLKRKRKELGLSQDELAKRIGVSRPTVTAWETSTRYPTIDKLYDIAKCLETSVNTLVSEVEKPMCKVHQTPKRKIF